MKLMLIRRKDVEAVSFKCPSGCGHTWEVKADEEWRDMPSCPICGDDRALRKGAWSVYSRIAVVLRDLEGLTLRIRVNDAEAKTTERC